MELVFVLKQKCKVNMLRPSFFIFCFTDFLGKKLGSEDEMKINIKFIRTIFQLNLNRRRHNFVFPSI